MSELKDYFEILENAPRMEKIMISVGLYNKTRGGGILWTIFYWILYFLSVYFLHSHLIKGIPNLFELIVFMALFFIGCFLTYGVVKQLSIMRLWHRQQYKDFITIRTNLIETAGNELWSQKFQSINDLISNFEKQYFPKIERSLAVNVRPIQTDL